MAELQEAIENSFIASFANVITFTCTQCNSLIPCNEKGLQQTHFATCMNPNCNARFYAEQRNEGEFFFQLDASSFPCLKCGQEILLENKKIAVGIDFACDSCKTTHQVIRRQWEYGAVLPPTDTTSEECADG